LTGTCLLADMFFELGQCFSCSIFDPACASCSSSECTACPAGYILLSGSCITCANFHDVDKCVLCTTNVCLAICLNGYYPLDGVCVTCSSDAQLSP